MESGLLSLGSFPPTSKPSVASRATSSLARPSIRLPYTKSNRLKQKNFDKKFNLKKCFVLHLGINFINWRIRFVVNKATGHHRFFSIPICLFIRPNRIDVKQPSGKGFFKNFCNLIRILVI